MATVGHGGIPAVAAAEDGIGNHHIKTLLTTTDRNGYIHINADNYENNKIMERANQDETI
jgi:hypothetical protein